MERGTAWTIAITILLCAVAFVAICALVVGFSEGPVVQNGPEPVEPSPPSQKRWADQTLRERQGWLPRDFFKTLQGSRAAEAISDHDNKRLQELIDSGLDVNLSGEKGMTLLFWSFLDDNLDAFKCLLASGANPDEKLTDRLILRRRTSICAESILFASVRDGEWEFFFAALPHTSDVKQVDGIGETFLLAATRHHPNMHESVVKRMIAAGVDPDTQNEDGSTAAMLALENLGPRWPSLCLAILEAGADSSIRNNRGDTIADRLAFLVALHRRNGEENRFGKADRLQKWLQANAESDTHNGDQ